MEDITNQFLDAIQDYLMIHAIQVVVSGLVDQNGNPLELPVGSKTLLVVICPREPVTEEDLKKLLR